MSAESRVVPSSSSSYSSSSHLYDLPRDVLLNCVLPYLQKKDIYGLLSVCRAFLPWLIEARTLCVQDVDFVSNLDNQEKVLEIVGIGKDENYKRKLRLCIPYSRLYEVDHKVYNFVNKHIDWFYKVELKFNLMRKDLSYLADIVHDISIDNPTAWSIPRYYKLPWKDNFLIKLHKLVVNERNEIVNLKEVFNADDDEHPDNEVGINSMPIHNSLATLQGIKAISINRRKGCCKLDVCYGCVLETVMLVEFDMSEIGSCVKGIKNVILHDTTISNFGDLCDAETLCINQYDDFLDDDLSPLKNAKYLSFLTMTLGDARILGGIQTLKMHDVEADHFPIPSGQGQTWTFEYATIRSLVGFDRLHSLVLKGCNNITDISMLGNVQCLDVKHCPIARDKFPIPLQSNQKWSFDSVCIDDLSTFNGLSKLKIRKCDSIKQVSGLVNITLLELEECNELKVIKCLHAVSELRVKGCRKFTTMHDLTAVKHVYIAKCCQLTSLKGLENVPRISLVYGDGIKTVDISCEGKEIVFDKMNYLKDIQRLEKARNVSLLYCRNLTEVSALRDVAIVTIVQCSNIIDVSALRNTKVLTLTNCCGITDVDMLETVDVLEIDTCCNISSQKSDYGWDSSMPTEKEKAVAPLIFDYFTLSIAVRMWCTMRKRAHLIYGHISTWNVSNVKSMRDLFKCYIYFNDDIANWNVSNVKDMSSMFEGAQMFNQPLNSWNTGQVENMNGMFRYAKNFNQSINSWNVSKVKSMQYMFQRAKAFNQPLDNWDTQQVQDMSHLFSSAKSFNQPIEMWNVSKVVTMQDMLFYAIAFNQPLSGWNVSGVTNMSNMFLGATSFNQVLNRWDVSAVFDMSSMFDRATVFNQPLHKWNVGQVQNMSAMFEQADRFNQALSAWDVSNVEDMSAMFRRASSFNQPLSRWKVNRVIDISNIFEYAVSFNQPLGRWDVRSVRNMNQMFLGAKSFNQPLTSWDIINVDDIYDIFDGATSFKQLRTLQMFYARYCDLHEDESSDSSDSSEHSEETNPAD